MQYMENFLSTMNIPHERIHPATPKEDAHIEHSTQSLREVMRRFEFEAFEEGESTIERFVNFYNNERLNTGIGYVTPGDELEMYGIEAKNPKSYKMILYPIIGFNYCNRCSRPDG